MKVLLGAYACEPGKGSEPGVGWNWAKQIARFHEVWVLTRGNNREALQTGLAGAPEPNLHFIYYDLPKWARFWKRGRSGVILYYFLWQWGAYRLARKMHGEVQFDIAHHITFNSLDLPGFLWRLPVPFVAGPLGGGQRPPAALKSYFGHSWFREELRSFRKRLLRYNPILRLALSKATVCMAANADTEELLRRLGAQRVIRFLETGIDFTGAKQLAKLEGSAPLRVLWVGGLIPLKGLPLALDSLAVLIRRSVPIHLEVAGDGPERARYVELVTKLGLTEHVTFLGQVPHKQLDVIYASNQVFLFTSMRDTSGNVVLEAMAHGLPVVALAHHGVAEIVDDTCGIRVPVGAPPQTVAALSDALWRLVTDGRLRTDLGNGAVRRVAQHFDWKIKGDVMNRVYADIYSASSAD